MRSAAESWEESRGGELRHQDKGTQSQRGSKNRAEEEPRLKKNWPIKAKFGRILFCGLALRGGESQIGLGGLQSSRLLNSDSTTPPAGLLEAA